jgi:hypothetical protein
MKFIESIGTIVGIGLLIGFMLAELLVHELPPLVALGKIGGAIVVMCGVLSLSLWFQWRRYNQKQTGESV